MGRIHGARHDTVQITVTIALQVHHRMGVGSVRMAVPCPQNASATRQCVKVFAFSGTGAREPAAPGATHQMHTETQIETKTGCTVKDATKAAEAETRQEEVT